jgi:hypothetical protein
MSFRESRGQRTYVGVHNDHNAGLTDVGRVVRDAWVFGILPETETCEGWSMQRIQLLYDQVSDAWAPYGHLASALPEELRERHRRIYDEAVAAARARGWDPELDASDE